MATIEAVLTAEDYYELPDWGVPSELVRGKVVLLEIPGFRHGRVCGRAAHVLYSFASDRHLGHVLCNNAGVVTERGPDTVRGPDVSFYSHARIPKRSEPIGYPPAPPELVFEVLSPSDWWPELEAKVAEYLKAGVEMVCVVDPECETLVVYDAHQPGRTLTADEEPTFPAWLGGFRLEVRRLFA
jgi:Uma2 family endonuclease